MEIVSKIRAGTVVHGRPEVVEFIRETVAPSLYDAAVEVYTTIDADRVIAEGRLRWIDEERVIRDDPVVWALEFRDELLLRFVAARTTLAAEAILGVARARQEPVVRDGQIVPRLLLPLSLTFDHRVADGADGARFASAIVRRLEHPDQLLLGL